MESKDEAAVERQKLVDDGEIENEADDEPSTITSLPASAPKSLQTPNSPVLSNKVGVNSSAFSLFWDYHM